MHPTRRAMIAGAVASLALAPRARALSSQSGGLSVAPVLTGLDEPWALGFLPEGGLLVTERAGRLRHLRADGTQTDVQGLPQVSRSGQGGLLDILIPRDFARTREVFLTYAAGRGPRTTLGAGRLSDDGTRLEDFRPRFSATGTGRGGRHFGSRVVEAPDGTLFLTTGDRGDDDSAQDPASHQGKVLRLTRAGGVPADNPFADGARALPEIWSLGHRNPQGAALGPDGTLWTVEHGARGGDEVNRPVRGGNHGWPVISYGRHYSGLRIGEGTERPGMEQPLHYWDPSIAPSGLMIHSGRGFPQWRGSLFTGSLNSDYLSRLDPARPGPGGWTEERIAGPETQRVRDVREGPDGSVWFLSVGQGALYRIAPG